MDMHQAARAVGLWITWSRTADLAEPDYVTMSVHDGKAHIGFQFKDTSDVIKWGMAWSGAPVATERDGNRFTRTSYVTPEYEVQCYSVTPTIPLVTPPSFAATP